VIPARSSSRSSAALAQVAPWGIDDFLAELLLDRAELAAEEAGRLPQTAGSGTVAGNIAEAATSWLGSHSFALASLLLARPALITRVHERSGGRAPAAVDQVEAAFAASLAAEQKLCRVAATAATGTLALALVGTVHHVFLTHAARDPKAREQVERIVSAVLSGQVIDAPGGRS